MKTYIDVLITSRYENPADFILAIKTFTAHTDRWEFLDEQSEKYSLMTGEPSCALLNVGNKYSPAVAITVKRNNVFFIANIVPKESGYMSMKEYNDIAKQLVTDVRKYANRHKLRFKIKTTHEDIGLPQIIRGTKTRELFERYLRISPTSYHPCDIKRLDAFICAVARYSKGKIDLDLLKDWLRSEKNWSEKDASWCTSRIKTGLDVLKVNRGFY